MIYSENIPSCFVFKATLGANKYFVLFFVVFGFIVGVLYNPIFLTLSMVFSLIGLKFILYRDRLRVILLNNGYLELVDYYLIFFRRVRECHDLESLVSLTVNWNRGQEITPCVYLTFADSSKWELPEGIHLELNNLILALSSVCGDQSLKVIEHQFE
jgi:hypothetical protein